MVKLMTRRCGVRVQPESKMKHHHHWCARLEQHIYLTSNFPIIDVVVPDKLQSGRSFPESTLLVLGVLLPCSSGGPSSSRHNRHRHVRGKFPMGRSSLFNFTSIGGLP